MREKERESEKEREKEIERDTGRESDTEGGWRRRRASGWWPLVCRQRDTGYMVESSGGGSAGEKVEEGGKVMGSCSGEEGGEEKERGSGGRARAVWFAWCCTQLSACRDEKGRGDSG